jgi:hypothetical protein
MNGLRIIIINLVNEFPLETDFALFFVILNGKGI